MKYFLIILMCQPMFAIAGQDGSGGDAVVCFANNQMNYSNIKSVELFDYWENAQTIESFTQLEMNVDEQVQIILIKTLKRLARLDKDRADRYLKRALFILNNITKYLVTNADLTLLNDNNPLMTPIAPCYKVRFAVQRNNPAPLEAKFSIISEIYNSPATKNHVRAGIILHEVIYEHAISLGHTDSDATRKFNLVLSSNVIDGLTQSEYNEYVYSQKLTVTDEMKSRLEAQRNRVCADAYNAATNAVLAWKNTAGRCKYDSEYSDLAKRAENLVFKSYVNLKNAGCDDEEKYNNSLETMNNYKKELPSSCRR